MHVPLLQMHLPGCPRRLEAECFYCLVAPMSSSRQLLETIPPQSSSKWLSAHLYCMLHSDHGEVDLHHVCLCHLLEQQAPSSYDTITCMYHSIFLWFQEDAHDFLRQWLDKVHDLHEKILKNGLPSKQVAAQ